MTEPGQQDNRYNFGKDMNPEISVLIPTYNRAPVLRQTLESMCALEFPEGFAEFIVVDNNSTDNTREVIEGFNGRLPVIYGFEQKQGQMAARITAVGLAKGGLFIFTDDDITPGKDWLKLYADAAEKWPDYYVFGGPVVTIPPEGVDPVIVQAADVLGLGHLELDICEGVMPHGVYPLGAHFMLRRDAFEKFGLTIDPSIGPRGKSRISGSETSIFRQLADAGQKVVYLPDTTVMHRTDREFWSMQTLKRRAFGQGRGRAHFAPVEPGCKRLFGIPRFLFSAAASLFLEECRYLLTGNRVRRFQVRLSRMRCLGTILEYMNMAKANNAKSKKNNKCSGS